MMTGVVAMRWVALAGGLLGGALNYALLAAGCKQLVNGAKRGVLFILGGVSMPVTGLLVCAYLSPGLLIWFGCACAGALILPAIARMAYYIRKKM